MLLVRLLVLSLMAAAACAVAPAPRATITIYDPTLAVTTVMVTPTTCQGCPGITVDPFTQTEKPPERTDEGVDPILRLKLELAGYTLVDVNTLRLESAERTDSITKDQITGGESEATSIKESATVATLTPDEQLVAARSLGITAILSSTLYWKYPNGTAELVLTLFRSADGQQVWTARCEQPRIEVVSPKLSGSILASCLGDAVLAYRAPESILTRTR